MALWNRELEARVQAQLDEIERMQSLKRFLAAAAGRDSSSSRGDDRILETHRRDIVVVFCDLRGFTAFAETAEPEEVVELLREYHGALGRSSPSRRARLTIFRATGLWCSSTIPALSRPGRAGGPEWRSRCARPLRVCSAGGDGAGARSASAIGIAQGYATLGQVGFAERIDYTAIGTVCNLAARLCAAADDGQILVSRRIAAAIETRMHLEHIGDIVLKGLSQPVIVYNIANASN